MQLVREEAAKPEPGLKFGEDSILGLNGFVHDVDYFFDERSYNRVPSGIFTGSCTITKSSGDLLCTYEVDPKMPLLHTTMTLPGLQSQSDTQRR
jgi:hypothetical protein